MELQPKSKVLGGTTFVVTPLGGMRGLLMLHRLTSIFGPALARADEDAADGLGMLFAKLPASELEAILQELLYNTTADGIPLFGAGGSFDRVFAGRAQDALKLAYFAVEEVNYAGFFGELAAKLLARRKPAEAAPSV